MPSLLIVEDDKNYIEVVSTKMTASGFEVYKAANGKEGLRLLEKNRIDAILMDMMMDEMDGTEMIYHIRKQMNLSLPIILLTNLEHVAFPDGVDHVFIKARTDLNKIVDFIYAHLQIS